MGRTGEDRGTEGEGGGGGPLRPPGSRLPPPPAPAPYPHAVTTPPPPPPRPSPYTPRPAALPRTLGPAEKRCKLATLRDLSDGRPARRGHRPADGIPQAERPSGPAHRAPLCPDSVHLSISIDIYLSISIYRYLSIDISRYLSINRWIASIDQSEGISPAGARLALEGGDAGGHPAHLLRAQPRRPPPAAAPAR